MVKSPGIRGLQGPQGTATEKMKDIGEFWHGLNLQTRAVPQLPDRWSRKLHRQPMTSDQMVYAGISLNVQLGHVGKDRTYLLNLAILLS